MADVIDLRDRGEQGELGGQLAQLFQSLAMRLDPDSALRKVIFPASYGERVAREVVQQAPPATAAQALTQGTRRAVAQEGALPLDEEARIGANKARAQGAIAEVDIEKAKRELATERELGKILSPLELAQIRALGERAGGATSEATMLQKKREADVLRIADKIGFTAQDEAEMAALQHAVNLQRLNLESSGLTLDERGMKDFVSLYNNATPKERKILTTGLAGPRGQLFGQFLLQEEQFNRESSLIRLRARLENAKTPAEILQAQFEYKAKIRGERDRLVDRIKEAGDDELPALVADINDLANDLLRADPTTFAMTAIGQEALFGDNLKGAEFDITDIIKERSDAIEVNARILALADDEEKYNTRVTQLRKSLTDPGTGVVNDRVFLATLQLAEQYKTENQDEKARDNAQKAAEDAWIAYVENPAALTEARKGQQSKTIEQELEAAIKGNASPATIADLVRRASRMKSFEYYLSGSRTMSPSDASRVAPPPKPDTTKGKK